MRSRVAMGLSLLGMLSMACGGSAHATSTGGNGGSSSSSTGGVGGAMSNFPEAPHPPLPQVKDFGGPVLATPKIVAITFPGDPDVAQIDDFVSKIGASSYFTGNVAEYGVGPATALSAVRLTSNPFPGTVDDAQIKTWITQQAGTGLPAADGSTIYMLVFLDSQTVTHQGGSSCKQFAGYHGEAPTSGGAAASYAIVARCASAIPGLTGLDQVTGTASHELIEASTNPFPDTKPAYQELETLDFGWEIGVGGGEIADMCAESQGAYVTPSGLGYVVQRTWSNKAALAGHDPCIPAASGAYFNSGAVMPDMVPLSLVVNGAPQQVNVKGVSIPIGSSKTIELDLFSDAATTGPWTVSARDFTVPPQMPIVTFSFDKTSGQNGDKIHLTITPLQAQFTNTESFVIESQSGTTKNTWLGLIGN